MVAPAGMEEAVSEDNAAAPVPSGTTTPIAPEDNVRLPGTEPLADINDPAPLHAVAVVGVTEAIGAGLTVSVTTRAHPAAVYEMLAVPAAMPVTVAVPPLAVSVATAVLVLNHVPPTVAFDNTVLDVGQTVSTPVVTAGGVHAGM